MELNFTLFVQIAHFFCAYLLLRVLLFTPALRIIAQEEQDHFNAYRCLQEHEESLEHNRHQVERAWQQCRDYFAQHTPSAMEPDVEFFRDIAPLVDIPACDAGDVQKERNMLKDAVIKKVEDVRA